MPDKAVISHRGEKYEIGRGKRFYGIWVVGAPYEAPVDRWPENRDGWQQAWSRFATMEVPGTITAVTRDRRSGPGPLRQAGLGLAGLLRRPRGSGSLLAGEGLLVLGVVLGLAGLFPAYQGSQSLISQANEVVPHLCYVLGWLLTAVIVALSFARPSNAARLGGLFGLGLSAVTFGLFLADLGQLTGGVSLGIGLVLSLLGWLACTAGSALAFVSGTAGQGRRQPSRPVRPGRAHAGPLALLVLGGIGTAAAFAPSWDSYTLVATASGSSQSLTAGNAFDNPALAVAGNVLVMVAVVAVAFIAALWRPARQGGLLLAGAIVPLAAEVVSALIQAGQTATPGMFGISQAQASALGLTISSGVTSSFWIFLVFVISLVVSCAWLFTEPDHPVMPGFPASPWLPAGGDQGTADPVGTAPSEDAESAASDEDNDVNDNADSQTADSGAADSRAADSPITEDGTADSSAQSEGGGQSAYA